MSDILHGHHPLVPTLIALLGLPKHTLWFELKMGVSKPATVRCEYYPQPHEIFTGADGEKHLRTILDEYEITTVSKVAARRPKIAVRAGLCSDTVTAEINAWLVQTFGCTDDGRPT